MNEYFNERNISPVKNEKVTVEFDVWGLYYSDEVSNAIRGEVDYIINNNKEYVDARDKVAIRTMIIDCLDNLNKDGILSENQINTINFHVIFN